MVWTIWSSRGAQVCAVVVFFLRFPSFLSPLPILSMGLAMRTRRFSSAPRGSQPFPSPSPSRLHNYPMNPAFPTFLHRLPAIHPQFTTQSGRPQGQTRATRPNSRPSLSLSSAPPVCDSNTTPLHHFEQLALSRRELLQPSLFHTPSLAKIRPKHYTYCESPPPPLSKFLFM
ncbi:hypothetical protein BD779DRAFT_1796425 [Infundibulicybe gibba]|nr:hypothetical protein BD779DRAFT_1796425 [Infundibulicybe gibba]